MWEVKVPPDPEDSLTHVHTQRHTDTHGDDTHTDDINMHSHVHTSSYMQRPRTLTAAFVRSQWIPKV